LVAHMPAQLGLNFFLNETQIAENKGQTHDCTTRLLL
jgi:hypothetical protein